MADIPVKLTEAQFRTLIEPHLSKAKRGYVSKIPLYKIFNYILYVLHTGCQWEETPIDKLEDDQPEVSGQVPRYHFYNWSQDGSFDRLFNAGIMQVRYQLNLSTINLDGSRSAAKKGAKTLATKVARRQKQVTSFR